LIILNFAYLVLTDKDKYLRSWKTAEQCSIITTLFLIRINDKIFFNHLNSTLMTPGFTGISLPRSNSQRCYPPSQGAALAGFWDFFNTTFPFTQPVGSDIPQNPGSPVTCNTSHWCAGVVKMCGVTCSDGYSNSYACGGCVGVGGLAINLW
jgi:hypothetical protein